MIVASNGGVCHKAVHYVAAAKATIPCEFCCRYLFVPVEHGSSSRQADNNVSSIPLSYFFTIFHLCLIRESCIRMSAYLSCLRCEVKLL